VAMPRVTRGIVVSRDIAPVIGRLARGLRR